MEENSKFYLDNLEKGVLEAVFTLDDEEAVFFTKEFIRLISGKSELNDLKLIKDIEYCHGLIFQYQEKVGFGYVVIDSYGGIDYGDWLYSNLQVYELLEMYSESVGVKSENLNVTIINLIRDENKHLKNLVNIISLGDDHPNGFVFALNLIKVYEVEIDAKTMSEIEKIALIFNQTIFRETEELETIKLLGSKRIFKYLNNRLDDLMYRREIAYTSIFSSYLGNRARSRYDYRIGALEILSKILRVKYSCSRQFWLEECTVEQLNYLASRIMDDIMLETLKEDVLKYGLV